MNGADESALEFVNAAIIEQEPSRNGDSLDDEDNFKSDQRIQWNLTTINFKMQLSAVLRIGEDRHYLLWKVYKISTKLKSWENEQLGWFECK